MGQAVYVAISCVEPGIAGRCQRCADVVEIEVSGGQRQQTKLHGRQFACLEATPAQDGMHFYSTIHGCLESVF
jgi:hypothetical protein